MGKAPLRFVCAARFFPPRLSAARPSRCTWLESRRLPRAAAERRFTRQRLRRLRRPWVRRDPRNQWAVVPPLCPRNGPVQQPAPLLAPMGRGPPGQAHHDEKGIRQARPALKSPDRATATPEGVGSLLTAGRRTRSKGQQQLGFSSPRPRSSETRPSPPISTRGVIVTRTRLGAPLDPWATAHYFGPSPFTGRQTSLPAIGPVAPGPFLGAVSPIPKQSLRRSRASVPRGARAHRR